MKTRNLLSTLIIIGVLIFISCGTPRMVYDFDKEADFTRYTSFDFYPDLQIFMSPFDSTRVIEQFEKALLIKGVKRTSKPDLYVNIVSEQFETPIRNSVGIGVGGTGRNVGVGIGGQIPLESNTITQVFTIEFIDVAKDLLVWQCTYQGRFTKNMAPNEKEAYFKGVFDKVLSEYPPR
ncbi:MAG: DUF4136 domain-containing protein [Flavobacteriaceae bacterium]|nr:DUF4136 domain-containing protein [Flavobacteriaceae bacterium]